MQDRPEPDLVLPSLSTLARALGVGVIGLCAGFLLGAWWQNPAALRGFLGGSAELQAPAERRVVGGPEPSTGASIAEVAAVTEVASAEPEQVTDLSAALATDPQLRAPALPEVALPRLDASPVSPAAPPRLEPPPPAPELPAVAAPPPSHAVPESRHAAVQVGAFRYRHEAESLLAALRAKDYPVYLLPSTDSTGGWWRVRVGPLASLDEARRTAARLEREQKLPGWVVRAD